MDFKKILGDKYTPELESEFKKAIGEEFVAKADFNEKNEALKEAKTTIAERDKQIKDLGLKATGNDELVKQIKDLTDKNTATQTEYEAKIKTLKEERILENELNKHNPISLKALKAELDLSKLKYTEDKLDGLAEQIDAIKKDENLKGLFKREITQGRTGGAKFNQTKPNESGILFDFANIGNKK
jgi:hypothetical protein